MIFSYHYTLILSISAVIYKIDQLTSMTRIMANWNNQNLLIGSYSKYNPFNNFQDDVSVIGYNSQLIYAGFDLDDQNVRFLHFVEFNEQNKQIKHIIKIITQSINIQEDFLIDYKNYEGIWISQYMYFDQSKLIIGIKYKNGFQEKLISTNQFVDNKFLLLLGGGLKIFDSLLNQTLQLSSFQGILKFFVDEDFSILDDINFLEQCVPLINNLISNYFSYKAGSYVEFQIEKEYINSYFLQFWMKIQSKESSNYILRLSINNSPNFIGQVGSNSVILNYEYLLQGWMYYFEYYSFDFPFIDQSIQDSQKSFLQDTISIEFISNWHLIQVKYFEKQLMIQLQSFILDERKLKVFENVNQYTNTKMIIYFGGNQYQKSENSGDIGSVIFQNCLNKNDKTEYCHFSCKTCFGPLKTQCLSCFDNQNRIFDPVIKSCSCKLWHYDNQKDHSCIGNQQNQYLETIEYLNSDPRYDEIQNIRACAFGYFRYKDECIQCPSASQKGSLQCPECIMNPETWVYNGKCGELYVLPQNIENGVFNRVAGYSTYYQTLYILIDNELGSCGSCDLCTEDESPQSSLRCFLYPFTHLDQILYIKCFFGYDSETYKCIHRRKQSSQEECEQYCESCDYDGFCNYCISPTKYFLSRENKCRECTIKNCKYCFQYNRFDYSQVSIISNVVGIMLSQNEEDYILACSLCNQGYVFNFQINECVQKQIALPCISGFISENLQFVCTNYQGDLNQQDNHMVAQFHDCSKYFSNCKSCIQDSFKMMYCITCFDGYYLQFQNGLCISCSSLFPNSKTCSIETSSLDSWKYELISFYLNFIPNSTPIQLLGLYYMSLYFLDECQEGYTQYYKKCVLNVENNCIIWNSDDEECQKCQNLYEEFDTQSYFDDKCQTCPYPCLICVPMSDFDINQVNPYFIVDQNTQAQTHRCLVNQRQDSAFIHQQSGQMFAKNSYNQKYFIKIQKPTFPNESISNQQNYIDFEYLKRRKPTTYVDKYNAFRDQDPINLRSSLFFMSNSTVLYDGFNDTYHDKQISITNQTTVNLQNIRFFSKFNQILIQSQYGVQIYVHNITLSNLIQESPILKLTNFTYLFISNLVVNEVTLINTPLLILNKIYDQTQLCQIVIEEISFNNCFFQNSSFIQLSSKLKQIQLFQLNKIILKNCQFIDFEFIKLDGSMIFIDSFLLFNLAIINSNFMNSQFLSLQNSNYNQIDGIVVQNCQIIQTILISLNRNSQMQNINFVQINLDYSIFLQYSQLLNFQSIHKIYGLVMENIFIQGKNPIKIFQDLQENSIIELNNIKLSQIQSNYQNQEEKQPNCLFDFQSNQINIKLLTNDKINHYWVFCIELSNVILIEDIHIINQQYIQYDPINNYSDLHLNLLNSGFVYLKKVQTATFYNIFIKSQNLIDSSIIYINTKIEQQLKNQQIMFSNIVFENNLLIKISSFAITSIIYLESEDRCNITISNVTFNQNQVIHQIFDSFTITSSLICILTQTFTYLKNIKFMLNEILFSSFPALYIKSEQIEIEQIYAQGVHELDLISYPSYISIIGNGGFFYLIGSQIRIIDSKFENSCLQEAEYLYILLQDQGNLLINNILINNIIVSSKENSNSNKAAFVIDASNSKMNCQMQNIQVSNILTQYQSGFLKILPSKIKNLLKLNNFSVTNVLSKQISFLDLACTDQDNNLVEIIDFQMNLLKDFFEKHKLFIGITEKGTEQSENDSQGMIYITNSSIKFMRLNFIGYAPVTILNLQDNQIIKINYLVMEQMEIKTKNLNIIKHEYFDNSIKLADLYLCQLIIKNSFSSIDIHIESFFQIYYNIPKRLIIKDILILNNTCVTCQYGLIFIKQFQEFNIKNSIFYNNYCGTKTCMQLNEIDQAVIQRCKFIKNLGFQGGAINLNANKVQMYNILFLFNEAYYGGALHQTQSSIKQATYMLELYFIQNTAKIGGAIYLENHSFRQDELIKMYFLDNKGQINIDNVKENPSQLRLSIFNKEIETKSKYNIGTPNFEKYKIQNIIYIPSGQQINNYNIQNLEQNTFVIYKLNPKLFAINNIGEKQINLQKFQCILQLINQKGELISNEDYTIPYNIESQSFDLSSLIISLDPYYNEQARITFDCDCFNENKYKFYFNVKSFPCQIGEFYYMSQCMKCDEQKGFYSVEKKATFCQKIDPKIIMANTASEIQLQPGYWRPNYRNQYINKCSKQKSMCLGGWEPGDKSCNIGYLGALCEECDIYNIKGDGQFYKNKNDKCAFCNEYGLSILISLSFGLLTIGSMVLTVSSVNTIFQSFLKLKLTSKYYKILFNHGLDQSAALIKTVVNYFQILVRVKSFQLELFFNINDILAPLSNPIGTTSYSYECFLSQQTEMQLIYISLIINILAPIFFYSLFLTVYLLLIYKKKLKLTPTIYTTAILYLFFYAQPNIILELGELITLRNISQIQYINRNVSILYFTNTHISWVLFFITPVLLIIGIIIPITLFLLLYSKRTQFNQEKVRKIWGYIFNDYKESSFYWEIFRVSEREIILLSLIIFEEQIEIKAILTFLILYLYHIIVTIKKPFNMETLNRFEQKCISLSSLIFLICGIKYQIQQQNLIQIDYILQTLLLIVFIYFFWILLTQTIQTYYHKYKDRLDGIRKLLQMKYPKIIQMFPFLKKYLKLRIDVKNKLKDRVKTIKDSLLMSKSQNILNSYHQNLNSFSVQKSIYHDEQISNFLNLQTILKHNEKEQSQFVSKLVPFSR